MNLNAEKRLDRYPDGQTVVADDSVLTLTVYGEPASQGSKNTYHGRPVESSKKLKPWRTKVAQAAGEAWGGKPLLESPLEVTYRFKFRRPKSHRGTGRNAGKLKPSAPEYHAQSPDLDKLQRAVNDALSGVVWGDDKYVVVAIASRHWTESSEGVELEIRRLVGETDT